MTLVLSPIRFLTFPSNLWIPLGDGPSSVPEFIVILLLLEADPSCTVSVQSCIVFGVMLPRHFTNMGHLSPKGRSINV